MKPGSQRQKEYLKRFKDKNRDEYLEKERKIKNKKANVIYFTFFHTLYFSTFKQPSSILKSLFWEKQKGVEAAETVVTTA